MRLFSLCGAVAAISVSYAGAATNFVSSVSAYTPGNVFIASGASYNQTASAIGPSSPIVGGGTVYAGILTPFNAHYGTDQLVVIGQGTGSITMQFAAPVIVNAETKVGIYTNVAFEDVAFPVGGFSENARNYGFTEYSAERTAVVEVGDAAGNFVSLGRQVFDDPTNYYNNAASAYQYPAPANPDFADFGKPYDGTASFNGLSLAQGIALLNGSAGGTWVTVPESVSIDVVTQIRISDTMWRLDDGTLVDQRTSIYRPELYVKPADLFIDAAVAIPEPALLGLLACMSGLSLRRRVTR